LLTPDRIKPFLLHEDPEVREAAVEYFADSWSQDPDLVAMVLDACDRFGFESNLRGLSVCDRFVLTERALDEVMEHLAGAKHTGAIGHLNRAIAHAPAELLVTHEAAIRNTPHFDRRLVPRLERRRDLADWSGTKLWEELQDYARRSEDQRHVGEIDHAYADDLIDALARQEVPDAETIGRLLRESAPEEGWLEIFLVDLAGSRRLVEAVPALVDKFRIDGDYLLERSQEALARIGDPAASRLIREALPGAEDHFQLYAASVLGKIKHPESEEAILALLETETDPTIRTSLCRGLCRLFSERGVEVVRREIASGYDTWYTSLEEALLPVADVLGIELPESEEWRREREQNRRMQERRQAELEEMGRRYQALKDRGIDPFARLKADDALPGPAPGVPSPIRRTEQKVGRNDPCPCGSGKKFKKCCGRA
jgi:hypothetical protein